MRLALAWIMPSRCSRRTRWRFPTRRGTLVCAIVAVMVVSLWGLAGTARSALAREPVMRERIMRERIMRRDSIGDAIAARLTSGRWPLALSSRQRSLVRALYAAGAGAPLWTDGSGLQGRALTLVNAISDAHTEGLRPDSYPIDTLRAALSALNTASQPTVAQLAGTDIILTAAYAALGDDLLTGQVDPDQATRAWHIDPQETEVEQALASALGAESFDRGLAALRPADGEYEALRSALARYRALARQGGWRETPGGRVIRPGDTASLVRLERLAARLGIEDFLTSPARITSLPPDTGTRAPSPSPSAVYAAPLTGAVAAFQAGHGLVVDSIVGPNTLAALNRPAEYRARQIAANLERHRWLPRSLGSRYVVVNVPAFRLAAFDSGRQVLTMKVIVGAEYGGRSTPVFSDSMSYVVFRPYWNVPQSIASTELWPSQRRDPGYLARHGFEVAQESWGRYVRQKPGPENALGLVKFIFPNDFAIYLHDTPADALFEEDVRAASHGCIRVERPAELAQYVLGWDLARIHEAMQRGPDDQRVHLDRKLPVYIVYFTTFTREGTLRFANDIYDRDDALVRAISGAAFPSDSTLRRAAELGRLARELAR